MLITVIKELLTESVKLFDASEPTQNMQFCQ